MRRGYARRRRRPAIKSTIPLLRGGGNQFSRYYTEFGSRPSVRPSVVLRCSNCCWWSGIAAGMKLGQSPWADSFRCTDSCIRNDIHILFFLYNLFQLGTWQTKNNTLSQTVVIINKIAKRPIS